MWKANLLSRRWFATFALLSIAALAAAFLFTSGALHVGQPKVQRIHNGMTVEQVEEVLGKPLPYGLTISHMYPGDQERIYEGERYHEIRVKFMNGVVVKIEDFERRHGTAPRIYQLLVLVIGT